ncbi:hypothetical protein BUALT_Bualt15G0136600 [Buddleja alternifolia]|uniref:RING-type domain-containing protein n=1 Tax=Buddleja alternifolia TaxID=168488 RepID=A0AAV6WDD7_9LAMI|nr:hypothetical protein BUALT_Bualt15G0136600 [Buddleja alternifolia]
MTARSLLLGGANPSPPSSKNSSPAIQSLDSDFVVILAALLCALICVVGLVAVARCACIRRISNRYSASPESSPPSAANKGLKKKVLKSLPKMTYGGVDDCEKYSDCAICLAEYAAGEEIRVLPQCGHGFHVTCIDTWLGSHSSCPSCRMILVSSAAQYCQKCGGLPTTATCSAAAAAGPQALPRESHLSSFLP